MSISHAGKTPVPLISDHSLSIMQLNDGNVACRTEQTESFPLALSIVFFCLATLLCVLFHPPPLLNSSLIFLFHIFAVIGSIPLSLFAIPYQQTGRMKDEYIVDIPSGEPADSCNPFVSANQQGNQGTGEELSEAAATRRAPSGQTYRRLSITGSTPCRRHFVSLLFIEVNSLLHAFISYLSLD